jgi:hypothetical protein
VELHLHSPCIFIAWCFTFTLVQLFEIKINSITLQDVSKPRTVASFLLRWPGFNPWSSRIGSVADKAPLRQVFSNDFGFPCPFSFHQLFHIHQPSYHQSYMVPIPRVSLNNEQTASFGGPKKRVRGPLEYCARSCCSRPNFRKS